MKNIKKKNAIKTQNRQKQPDKIHQKNNNKKHKNGKKHQSKPGVWQVLIILCFPSLFFSVCSGFVCLKPCILYAVRPFRLNKRGAWPKKALGRTATGKLNMFFFSVQQLGCLETMKSIKLRGQWIRADLWISKNRHTHVKCINRGAHGHWGLLGMPTEWLANRYVKSIKAQGFKTPRNPRNSKTCAKCIKLGGGWVELPLSTPSIFHPPPANATWCIKFFPGEP